jgi:hypothetical protein
MLNPVPRITRIKTDLLIPDFRLSTLSSQPLVAPSRHVVALGVDGSLAKADQQFSINDQLLSDARFWFGEEARA